MMLGRCSIIVALLTLAVSASKGAIMGVGGTTACPVEGEMFDCREMSVDFDALLAAEEVVIEGSAVVTGLLFGRDITISRDQVYEDHMYTYTVTSVSTVSENMVPKTLLPKFLSFSNLQLRVASIHLAQLEERESQNPGSEISRDSVVVFGWLNWKKLKMSQATRGVAAFLYNDTMGYGQLTGNVRVGRRYFQVQNCGENCHVFGRVNSNRPRGYWGRSLDRSTACTNGDALSFAECWAAKQLGFCSANLWLTQCEASCGNECE